MHDKPVGLSRDNRRETIVGVSLLSFVLQFHALVNSKDPFPNSDVPYSLRARRSGSTGSELMAFV